MSQIFLKRPSFCFIKSRKNSYKNALKVSGVLSGLFLLPSGSLTYQMKP